MDKKWTEDLYLVPHQQQGRNEFQVIKKITESFFKDVVFGEDKNCRPMSKPSSKNTEIPREHWWNHQALPRG